MVSKIFGNALICKKIFMPTSGEFYVLHIFGELRWSKMVSSGKADQFDLATSDKYIYET